MKITVGQTIKQLRLEKGLTQQQVADALKMDRGNFGKYERDRLEFGYEMLVALSKLFGVTCGQLLGTEDL